MKKDLYERPKYLSKVGADRSLYGMQNINPDLDYVFIFEGPIDSYFVENGLATCGITENSSKMFTALQKQQINKLTLYEKIYVLDNQYCDKAALNKSIALVDNNEKVFICERPAQVLTSPTVPGWSSLFQRAITAVEGSMIAWSSEER